MPYNVINIMGSCGILNISHNVMVTGLSIARLGPNTTSGMLLYGFSDMIKS